MPNGVHLVVNDVHGKVTVVNDISLKIKFLLYESFTCDFSKLTKYFKKKKKKKQKPMTKTCITQITHSFI